MDDINRRRFFKYLSFFSAGVLCSNDLPEKINVEDYSKKVVIAQNDNIRISKNRLDFNRIYELLSKGIKAYFNVDKHEKGWRKVIPKNSTVGIKVNCLAGKGGASTQIEVTKSIVKQLVESGMKESKIIVFDRMNNDLKRAGYDIDTWGKSYRCYGNNHRGYEKNLRIYRSIGSLFARTFTEECDVVINVPVLKDHGICGYTGALKNMFGIIHNPNKYHDNVGNPYIADLNDYPPVRKKVVISVMDATHCQYNGGPPYLPHWSYHYNGLLIGVNPLALDTVGVGIIEDLRNKFNLPTLKEDNRDPVYLNTAAELGLGTNNIKDIKIVRV